MPTYNDLLEVEEPIEDETPNEEEFEDAESAESDEVGEGETEEDAEGSPEGEGEGEAEGEGEGEEPAPIVYGKAMPPELKELAKLHPERAKLLKDIYFTNAAYQKYGKVADLQKMQEYIQSYGSLEEAQKVKERLDSIGDLDEVVNGFKEYEALDNKFSAGDPAYVDHLAKVNPEAFGKLAPSFISRFGSDHPEAYNYLMSQVVLSTMINDGTANAISLLQQAAASGNVETVKQIADKLANNLNVIQQLSQKAPAVKTTDPRVAELEAEKTKLREERVQQFAADVKERANVWASPLITTALKPYGKIKPEMLKLIDRDTKAAIGDILSQKPDFQAKIRAAFMKGDREASMRLYNQYVTPLINAAARKTAAVYGLRAAAKKANGAPAPTGQRPAQTRGADRTRQRASYDDTSTYERVTEYPGPKDVRRDIPNYYQLAERNMFVLKDGRRIRVVD